MKNDREIEKCEDVTNNTEYDIETWDDLEMDSSILRGIYAYGFEKPSPIQKKAIKPILLGKDIIAQAQSGTGKTATFSIGALSILNLEESTSQVLIISPTRELTIQTATVISNIGSLLPNLKVQTLFGGSSVDENIEQLKNHPAVLCGCPGRVYDLIRRNKINTKTIKLMILDEADELLSQGFKEQIYNIFKYLNNDVQVALFSATLPAHLFTITDKFMRDPVKIIVKTEQLTLEGISQFYVAMEEENHKYDTLKDLYSHISLSQCIIYCNSVRRVEDLYEWMLRDGFPVCCIHSNMERHLRENAFLDFRNGKSRVLISSNVTSRGIDIQQVSTVINYDIPKDIHNYLHRIGRSGRWGRKGFGINFITRRDVHKMKEIEQYYSCEVRELPADLSIFRGT
jgi:translation initiation factor 4A